MVLLLAMSAGSLQLSAQPGKQPPTHNRNIGTVSRDQARFKKEKTRIMATRQQPGGERVVYNNRTYDYNNGRFYMENNGRYIQAPPPRGMHVKSLPSTYVRINFGNIFYYFFEGVFYSDRNGYYEVVYPEVGTVVDALPADYEKVVYNGETFYEYNGVLYEKLRNGNQRGYRVVGYLS
ncbi:MAG: DUF6515 family protein [Flavihumibacter sp.]